MEDYIMNSQQQEAITKEISQIEAAIEALQIRKIELETQLAMNMINQPHQQATPRVRKKQRQQQVTTPTTATNTKKQGGRRDINEGDKKRIDESKELATAIKPQPVQQSKGVTKKNNAEKAKNPKAYKGMSYKQLREEVSTRKAKLNAADQARLAKVAKNNTWQGAIACLEWLELHFPSYNPTKVKPPTFSEEFLKEQAAEVKRNMMATR
jgi:hypothetical protein